ncbi:GntR family transcriptional regulator [Amycolatopsis nigrescens]|uniref:GntR family transcriptional regulator n=1 Tax=Amycolatopsis nigrescens TaxID=381445 RepID=UPI001FDFC37C|nr:GntR family transcriptional regulator [Amycolatopsis nigrescens]
MDDPVDASSSRKIPAGWVSSRPRAERARQLADALRHQIITGRFADGVLPDERGLGSRFGASRNAVREALALLRQEGLITRRRGVGTTVVLPKYGHGLDRLAGLAETLTGYGTVTNEVRLAETVAELPAAIAERLAVPAGSGGVHLERLRWLDGLPLSLDSSYLTADAGRGVLAGDLAGRDVFTLIEETTGCLLGRAEVAIHAVTADPDTAELLRIPAGAAVFALERLTRLSDGRPVDVESIRIRADRMALHAVLHRGGQPW